MSTLFFGGLIHRRKTDIGAFPRRVFRLLGRFGVPAISAYEPPAAIKSHTRLATCGIMLWERKQKTGSGEIQCNVP